MADLSSPQSKAPLKVLFLPNWRVNQLAYDAPELQPPDKQIKGQSYWFFRHFESPVDLKVIDFQQKGLLHSFEKRIGLYITQSIRAIVQSRKYDLVVSHGAQSGLVYSLLNRLPFRKRRPPHVIIDIGGMNGGRSNRLECWLVRFALGSRPNIICHSSSLLDYYKTTYPIVYGNAAFMHFGVDVEEFLPINTSTTKHQVLSFGYAKRDYQTLIKSWSLLKTNAVLKIIGSNMSVESDSIICSEGLSLPDLKLEIAQSLFVVIPLPWFNYSYGQMSFLQSMSMGKPVIVTSTPSSIDYLLEGSGATLVRNGDHIQLSEEINKLLMNEEYRSSQGQLARIHVESQLSERKMAHEFERHFHQLIDKGRADHG